MTRFFASIEAAINQLRAGGMVVLMDDESRENEGDLVIAAQHITPEAINFMTHYGRGLICLPMAKERIERLQLPMMTTHNRSPYGTGFTVSIEARTGVSTGISASDRAHTIQVAIADETTPEDIISPGHIFPLRACEGGVLERQGQTEGSVDLMKLAGLKPAAVICEILNDDGTMSRFEDLKQFAETHAIPLVRVRDILHYRIQHEMLVEAVATSRLPLHEHGDFNMTLFQNKIDQAEHFTLVKMPFDVASSPLVRIHSECITGDVFGSTRCDCGDQLQASLARIAKEGGILVYLRQEGRGIGLSNKLKAYALQDKGLDTVEANLHLGLPIDSRDYAIAFQLLTYWGLKQVRLLTNNPNKVNALEGYGMTVTERVPLCGRETPENQKYLKVKREKLGHFLGLTTGDEHESH